MSVKNLNGFILTIFLSILLASSLLNQDGVYPTYAAGIPQTSQWAAAAQVPAGLKIAEWTRDHEQLEMVYPESASLRSSDSQVDDNFGWSVAISGDVLVVGAPYEDGGFGNPVPDSGAAYIFERDFGGTDNWGEVAILYASDAQPGDSLGWSVAISADTIVLGAIYEAGGPGDPLLFAGAAYVFERNLGGPNNWGEAAFLHASDAQVSDWFGTSVSISEDTLVVGAFAEDGGPGNPLSDAGAAYVYERDLGGENNWGEAVILHASDTQSYDWFGRSVAISLDTIGVGANGEDGGLGNPLEDSGAAYVFSRDLGGVDNWGEAAILRASDAQTMDSFGRSVTISLDTIAVGAFGEDGGPGDPLPLSGAAYIFERNVGGENYWGEAAVLHASDAQSNDWFGVSAGISGETVVVGAYAEDGGPGDPLFNSGAAYVSQRSSATIYLPAVLK